MWALLSETAGFLVLTFVSIRWFRDFRKKRRSSASAKSVQDLESATRAYEALLSLMNSTTVFFINEDLLPKNKVEMQAILKTIYWSKLMLKLDRATDYEIAQCTVKYCDLSNFIKKEDADFANELLKSQMDPIISAQLRQSPKAFALADLRLNAIWSNVKLERAQLTTDWNEFWEEHGED